MRAAAALAAALLLLASCRSDGTRPSPSPEVTPAPIISPVPEGPTAPEGMRALAVASPRSGEEVVTPVRVRYSVSGFDGDEMVVRVAGRERRLPLPGPASEVEIPEVPEGTHDFAFVLARRGGATFDNPEATVVVEDVTVIERGAGGGGMGSG